MTQPLEERLAGRGRRLVATLIDMLLVPALTALLVMITGVMEHAEAYRNSMWMVHVFLLAVVSYLILNGYWLFTRGQTVGKRVMKVAIVATATGGASGALETRLYSGAVLSAAVCGDQSGIGVVADHRSGVRVQEESAVCA